MHVSEKGKKVMSNFVTKIVLTYCEKIVLVIENFFEVEGQEFAKILRSLEQFVQTLKGQQFLVTECFLNLFLEV